MAKTFDDLLAEIAYESVRIDNLAAKVAAIKANEKNAIAAKVPTPDEAARDNQNRIDEVLTALQKNRTKLDKVVSDAEPETAVKPAKPAKPAKPEKAKKK